MHERDTVAGPERISERHVYGEALAVAAASNCRGQRVRRYDTAGLIEAPRYTLSGQALHSVRQFLLDPLTQSDWQGEQAQWQALLEAERYVSHLSYNAQGAVLRSVDARGNQQRQTLDVAGQLASSALRLTDDNAERPILAAISYSAAGQVLQERAFNGVLTEYTYEPQTRRLSRLQTTRPAKSGRKALLQDLNYRYDPVGNILSIRDEAIETRYHNNQRIEPVNTYSYDAQYQLLRATGRENANAGQQGPGLPTPVVPIATDPNQFSQYTRLYRYDEGGNLTQMQHQGRQHYTLEMLVSPSSNRALRQTGQLLPAQVEGYFDAGGNLKALAPGQPMNWDGRNQLQRVSQVVRPVSDDDAEYYQYDGDGTRVSKTTDTHTDPLLRRAQVRYLPGLELRRTQRLQGSSPHTEEELHVIKVGGAGRQQVRVLHWETGQPADIPNNQLRGSLDNQLGSSLLELDQQADILTLEEYYPYGGTAVWSGKNASETHYKFARYSGKERDATGLYYYGFRYYAAWLGRWLNPDPAATVDGLNLFRMVNNNPVRNTDIAGLLTEDQAARTLQGFFRNISNGTYKRDKSLQTDDAFKTLYSGKSDASTNQLQGAGSTISYLSSKLSSQKISSPETLKSGPPHPITEASSPKKTERSSTTKHLKERAVEMGEAVTAMDNSTILSTRGLGDCSALATLSNWDGEIYRNRSLMHLKGSYLASGLSEKNAFKQISTIKKTLNPGSKIMWIGGLSSQSDIGIEISLTQNDEAGNQPLVDLIKVEGTSTILIGSSSIKIMPNGEFEFQKAGGRGVLDNELLTSILNPDLDD